MNQRNAPHRHPREGGDPVPAVETVWIPAFAGMTDEERDVAMRPTDRVQAGATTIVWVERSL